MLMPPEFLYYCLVATCLLIPMGIGIMYSMIYNPFYAYFYLDWYIKTEKKHYQTELFLLLLLNIFYIV